MKSLTELAAKYNTDKNETYNGGKGHGYIKHYEKHLPEKVNSLLEIGCYRGESLRMWREFYPDADLYTIDLFQEHPVPQDIEGLIAIKGDQSSERVLFQVPDGIECVIDDGSHLPVHVAKSFAYLWSKLAPNGIYVIEDLLCGVEQFYRGSNMDFEETILAQVMLGRFPYKHKLYDNQILFIWK